ncbi:MAG: hypothetical protein J5767_08680 [Paludibacteraceae bacterium]|nr:hypothetical protein [Paludibacteraceae bacterium]
MQELFDLIYGLLNNHTCVIVPSFGGFVVNDKAAEIHAEDNSFFPPMKEVIFNQLLTHNDGLLAQEIMRRKGISFEEANREIGETVNQIQQVLSSDGSLEVSDWGVFRQEGQVLSFTQKRSFVVDKEAFGLSEFYFPELLIKEETKAQEVKRHRSTISSLLMGTAAAVVCLMVFQPLQNETETNPLMLQQSSLLLASLQTEVESQTKTINILQTELNSYKQAPVGFYLILADFANKNAAIDYIDEEGLEEDKSIQLLTIDNRCYISIASSMDKEELLEKKASLSKEMYDLDHAYILSVAKMNE